jgi:TIR domain
MRAFISHAQRERAIALRLGALLETLQIEAFLAHRDLRVSQDWRDTIVAELTSCDIFIPLLSAAFKESDWCGHESGMAVGRSDAALIIPISVDGTDPYGLLSNLQCHTLENEEALEEAILDAIGSKWPAVVIDLLIPRLDRAHSFRAAEDLMRPLVPYFDRLERAQATEIARKSVQNAQIWSAHLCRTEYLPAFLRLNGRRIPRDVLRSLRYQVEEQR